MANGKGPADFLKLGDWNVVCYECGRKKKASWMKRHWQGYYVCPEHWEPRQPQDFAKGIPDVQTPPWTQPMPADQFVSVSFSGIPTIASANSISPVAAFTNVSGTTTINTIVYAGVFPIDGTSITLIPTGLWSTGTSGNIFQASTAVIGKNLIMTYDKITAKWYPSY